jgi:hypothetical protein
MPMDHKDLIRTWMNSVMHDGGMARFDDLHIDQIDPKWKNPNLWIEGGLEVFQLATVLRNQSRISALVALAFSLDANKKPHGFEFKNASEFKSNLDGSPPSLHLFPPNEKPWTYGAPVDVPPIKVKTKPLTPSIFGAPSSVECVGIEFKKADSEEYNRTVFLLG